MRYTSTSNHLNTSTPVSPFVQFLTFVLVAVFLIPRYAYSRYVSSPYANSKNADSPFADSHNTDFPYSYSHDADTSYVNSHNVNSPYANSHSPCASSHYPDSLYAESLL